MKSFTKMKRLLRLALCAAILAYTPLAGAQQQTGNVVPDTRNPQNSPVELHQQQGDIQETSSQQLLNQQQGSIQIPAGRPAPTATSNDEGQNLWESYWYIILLGLLPAVLYAFSMKPDKPEPLPEAMSTDDTTPADVTAKKKRKKQSGKKKQPRSKRR